MDLNTFRNIFFGNNDRIIATTSAAITAMGTAATIFTVAYPEKIPSFLFVRDIFIVISLVATIMFLLHKIAKQNTQLIEHASKHEKYTMAFQQSFALTHSAMHSLRDESANFFSRKIAGQQDKDNYKKFFEAIAHSTTLDCQKVFLNYLNVKYPNNSFNISVSIKIITSAEVFEQASGKKIDVKEKRKIKQSGGLVYTAFRDPETHEMQKGRETNQHYYELSLNTAFDTIFNHKQNSYACDNLKALGATYKNQNKSWQDFYNATIVAPLRWNGNCYGFIAVDSLNKDNICLFESQESKEIIAAYADLMASCIVYSKYLVTS